MTGDEPFPVRHVCHAVFPQIDAANDIVDSIIFINSYDIHGSLSVFLHRHAHSNAKSALENCGRVGSQIIRLLKKTEKTVIKALRRAVNSLQEFPVKVIEGNRIQLIDLGGLFQNSAALLFGCPGIGALASSCHPVIAGDRHHPIRQKVDIRLHRFSGLTHHRLQAVQQNAICQ